MRQKNKNNQTRKKKQKISPKPAAAAAATKSRTKTRKPKYLSLKLQLSPKTKTKTPLPSSQKQQLKNLFPLRPENNNNVLQQQDKADYMQEADHMALLLDYTATDTSTTLHDLLDSTTTTTSSNEVPLSPPETYGGYDHKAAPSFLVRTAMRCKGRDASDQERWVSYSEVVEKKEQEEVSSCSGSAVGGGGEVGKLGGLVGLKLDYEEILNAWCDKGPLYIEGGESPQTVPDLLHAPYDPLTDVLVNAGNLWKVPEISNKKMKDKDGGKEGWKLGQREASVLRYKEKRQSRLFAKRIRYEVRKLNAEKRPRLKGRFVKRNEEEEE